MKTDGGGEGGKKLNALMAGPVRQRESVAKLPVTSRNNTHTVMK